MDANKVIQCMESGLPVSSSEPVPDLLVVSNQTFDRHVRFFNCTFRKDVELTNCRFALGAEFIECTFERAFSMESSRVEGDLHFRACAFHGEARFERLHVNGKLEARAPRSREELSRNSKFIERPFISFSGFANFSQIRVSGEANFGSAQFEDGVDFYGARIEGPVFFRKDYCKRYRKAQKEAEARNKRAPYIQVYPEQLDDAAFPDSVFPPVLFGGARCRFRDAYLGGELNFHAATFDAPADLSYLKVQGVAFFCYPEKPNETPLPCRFSKEVKFEGAQFQASLKLHRATFPKASLADFLDCRVRESLEFYDTFPPNIRLTGCTYKRLSCGGNYDPVIKTLKEFDRTGGGFGIPKARVFDRSSWIQLESSVRNDGESEHGDWIYRTRMREQRAYEKNWIKKSFSYIWDRLSSYGTASWKLAALSLVVLAGFSGIFYRGELETNLKSDSFFPGSSIVDPVCVGGKEWSWTAQSQERIGMALEISILEFVPIKLPLRDECSPKGGTQRLAAVEKLLGWILVPVLVANVTGLLSRKAKSESEAEEGGEG